MQHKHTSFNQRVRCEKLIRRQEVVNHQFIYLTVYLGMKNLNLRLSFLYQFQDHLTGLIKVGYIFEMTANWKLNVSAIHLLKLGKRNTYSFLLLCT